MQHQMRQVIVVMRDSTAPLKLFYLFQINSETDFVARNEKFMGLVSAAAQAALKSNASIDSFPRFQLADKLTEFPILENDIAQ